MVYAATCSTYEISHYDYGIPEPIQGTYIAEILRTMYIHSKQHRNDYRKGFKEWNDKERPDKLLESENSF